MEQKNFFINLRIGRRCFIDALVTSLNLLSAGEGYYYWSMIVFGIYSS